MLLKRVLEDRKNTSKLCLCGKNERDALWTQQQGEEKVSNVHHLLKTQAGFCGSKLKHGSIRCLWCNILALVGCYTAILK